MHEVHLQVEAGGERGTSFVFMPHLEQHCASLYGMRLDRHCTRQEGYALRNPIAGYFIIHMFERSVGVYAVAVYKRQLRRESTCTTSTCTTTSPERVLLRQLML